MTAPTRAPRPLTIALLCLGLLVAAVAPAANAHPERPFSADVLPTCVPSNASVTFTATIRNEAASDTLRSAKIEAPAGFTITAIVTPPATGAASFEPTVIRLAGLLVPPGGSTSVVFQATTATAGVHIWHVGAKRSADPDGPPKDDMVFRGGGSHVETLVDLCVLRFVVQPADADSGANVSGAAFDPEGPPVAVEVLDGPDGARVTTSSDPVSLELLAPPEVVGAALSPAVPTVAAVNGLATFDAGAGDGFSITPPGVAYRLRASAGPGIAAATSDPFDVVGTGVVCTGPGCSETVVSSTGVTVEVTAPDAEPGDVITVLLDAESLDCAGYTPLAGTPVITFSVTGDSIRVITIRVPAALATRPLNQHKVCYSSVLSFTDNTGAIVNTGLLPNCSQKDPAVPPCQRVSRLHKPTGDHIISFLAPPGSTKGRT